MVLLLAMIVAWAIVYSGEQVYTDARAGLANARKRTTQRVTAIRTDKRAPKWKRRTATAAVGTAKFTGATYRGARHVGHSLAQGARKGAAEGRRRYETRKAEKAAGDTAREPEPGPSRRWDKAPETDTDARFFDLRDSGYTGPIDQDGNRVDDLDEWIEQQRSHTDGRYAPIARAQAETNGSSNGGTITMSAPTNGHIDGETLNIESTRNALTAFESQAAAHLDTAAAADEQAGAMAAAAEQMLASLSTNDLDAQTLADVASLQEQAAALAAAAAQLREAAEGTVAAAGGTRTGMDSRHAGVEEAINSTEHAAQRDFYKHQ